MRVETTPGRGTSFTVLFPASSAPSSVATSEPDWEPGPGKGRTILVVDDEPAVREVVVNLLEEAGYRVLLASDGPEGVKTLQRHGRAVDLVLLDMTMPGLSGDEALEEMCRIQPTVRVLLSSGYTRPDTADRFPAQNLAGFIQKPYGADELSRKIAAALAEPRS
jgi:CheY-like chemotaxis protein